jgi:hypothetical protein
MPFFDGTGPRGKGPMTGLGRGKCKTPKKKKKTKNKSKEKISECIDSLMAVVGRIARGG